MTLFLAPAKLLLHAISSIAPLRALIPHTCKATDSLFQQRHSNRYVLLFSRKLKMTNLLRADGYFHMKKENQELCLSRRLCLVILVSFSHSICWPNTVWYLPNDL
mmetsp:Transcript_23514/g.42667  ORF Transcript_23514/g.42667 Transcript_23514/m.42667 type:complete len:105 (+) Transcript_23514:83-397(+)